jgi:quinol monooxygenase YgiN
LFGILFRVEAKPGKYHELVDFLMWDGEVCRDQEPGTLRFEFYRDADNDSALYVYEAYRDIAAFEVHKSHEPFRRFFEAGLKQELTTNLTVLFRSEAVWSPVDGSA